MTGTIKEMKTPGRFDYVPLIGRPDYTWPNGTRLAVHYSLNIEVFTYGEGLGNDLAVPSPQPNHRSWAWREYGNRVGVWRMWELAEEYKIPYGILLNSKLYDHCPQVLEAFAKRGDEMVGHGRTNSERQIDMDHATERAVIQEVQAAITKHWGKPARGWLAPYISQTHDSLDLLREAGFTYCMDWPLDDQPVWMRTKHGPILNVPYPNELNDSLWMVSRRSEVDNWARCIIDQFDEMLEESERRPLVLGLPLHTFVLGQPYRLRWFRRIVEHIQAKAHRCWVATPGQIAEHCMKLPKGIVPGSEMLP